MSNIDLSFLLNKYYISDSKLIEISNEILKGNLVIKYKYIPQSLESFPHKLIYDSKNSWELDYGEHTNMYMLHLHALEPVSYLLLTYEITNDKRYLDKAFEITIDWNEHSRLFNHFYLWYRHCVSDRAIVLSQLYKLTLDDDDDYESERQTLNRMMLEHKHYLFDQKNYILHNHGTLVDMGLLALSIVTNDELTIGFSKDRLSDNFLKTFTDNMICVENSISYSIYNIELFIKVEKYILNPIGLSIDPTFDEKMNLALDFLSIVKKHDDTFPNLGDGEKLELDYLKTSSLNIFYPEHLLFKCSKSNVFKVYPEEGYVIIKNEKDYLFMTAGDIKKNHKHADDLSFILSYDKEDVLVDSGTYSYTNNEIRGYQKSALAHNTLVLNNTSYNYLNSTREDIRILKYQEKDKYYFISMINKSSPYGNVVRHIYVIKNDYSVIICDRVKSTDVVLATQNYNLNPILITKEEIKLGENNISIGDQFNIVSLDNSMIDSDIGNGGTITNTVYSEKFHHKISIHKVTINRRSKDPNILTVITRKKDIEIQKLTDELNKYEFKLKIEDKDYRLKASDIEFEWSGENNCYLEISQDGNILKGATIGIAYDEQEYSWDILKESNKIDNIWYQKSNKFEYEFDEGGVYRIRFYIRDINDPTRKIAFLHDKDVVIPAS